jgi:thioredoxin reductase (NADPH)
MAAYDVIVIGAGPAGLTAAVFTARARLRTLVFSKPGEGMIHEAVSVGNYLGCDGWSGERFLAAGVAQVRKYGAEVLDAEVVHAERRGELFAVKTHDQREFEGKALVIATGESYVSSGVEGEKAFTGRGVAFCVACDGPLFRGKRVAVIGNGSYAAEEALELLAHTKDVAVFSNGREFELSPEFRAALERAGVPLRKEQVLAFRGEKFLQELELEGGQRLPFQGAFVALGTATAFAFAYKLGLERGPANELVINRDGETNVPGVYAAGGCTGGNAQIAKSAGEGCNAAVAIIKRLTGKKFYVDQT